MDTHYVELDGSLASLPPVLAVVPGPGLLFGLMLLAAIAGGFIARFVHIPRVIGYLVGGMSLRAILRALIEPVEGGPAALEAAAEPLQAINDLALGMILFSIGGVFERSKLRGMGRRLLRIAAAESGMVLLFVFVGALAAGFFTQREHGVGPVVALSLLLAAAGIATAPAATLFVLREYQAKGPVTSTILDLVGLNNVLCIVLFHVLFLLLASMGLIDVPPALGGHLWSALAWATVGSVVLGVAVGALLSVAHAKLPLAETSLIFFATLIVLGAGEKWLLAHVGPSFNFLLTALVVGVVFHNVAIDSEKLPEALRTVATPIFAGFFVIAGYSLHLGELARLGWVGGVYVVCRCLGKTLGVRLGIHWASQTERLSGGVGEALLCQAAVVIGLAAFVEQNWRSELAAQFSTVVLGSVVVFELIGPLLVKRCAVRGGEVKAIALLRRGREVTEGGSVLRITLDSLLGLLDLRSGRDPTAPRAMQVRHIMRRNAQLVPASATLGDVLHFIEHSTHNHFPVVHENGDFAGVIHFSDVRDVIYDPTASDLVTALDLADPESPVVPMDLPLEELLGVFTSENVGVLPVGEPEKSRHIVGIVEQRDLLRALHGRLRRAT